MARKKRERMSEQALFVAARRGDVNAFNQLVLLYQGPLFNAAYHLLGDRDAAGDVLQRALLSAFKNICRFRAGSLKTWLLWHVVHTCYGTLHAPLSPTIQAPKTS